MSAPKRRMRDAFLQAVKDQMAREADIFFLTADFKRFSKCLGQPHGQAAFCCLYPSSNRYRNSGLLFFRLSGHLFRLPGFFRSD